MQLRTKGDGDDDEAPDAEVVVTLSVDDRDVVSVVSDGATLKARDEEDALLRFKL